MPFRLQTKTLFITYPQNDTTPQIAIDRIKNHFKDNLEYTIVAQENHKDGHKHLHILIHTFKKVDIRSPTLLNFIADKQGNYQSARNIKDVIQYITKDNEYIAHNIDVKEYLQATASKQSTKTAKGIFKILTEDILKNNLTYKQVVIKYPDQALQHGKKIQEYINTLQSIKDDKEYEDIFQQKYNNIVWRPFQQQILDIIEGPVDDRKIYWIYDNIGNNGKSYLTQYLEHKHNSYIITGGKNQDIYRHYKKETSIILDLPRDYSDNDSIYSVMENFKNGYILDTKYEGRRLRFQSPHIIVMANFLPNQSKLSQDRLQIIDINQHQQFNISTPYTFSNIQQHIDTYNNTEEEINSITNRTNLSPITCNKCLMTFSSHKLYNIHKNSYHSSVNKEVVEIKIDYEAEEKSLKDLRSNE